MKKLLPIFIIFMFIVTGCTIDLSSNDDKEVIDKEEKKSTVEEKKLTGKRSSLSSPLKIGDTGICSKFNVVKDKYEEVDIKLLSKDEVDIKDLLKIKDGYTVYILTYEVTLTNFKTESFGTNVGVDVEVLDTSGKQFVNNKLKEVTEVIEINSDTGVTTNKSGKVQIAFQVPDSYKEIIVVFGNNKGKKAYFKI